jgi:hypothetical protein
MGSRNAGFPATTGKEVKVFFSDKAPATGHRQRWQGGGSHVVVGQMIYLDEHG